MKQSYAFRKYYTGLDWDFILFVKNANLIWGGCSGGDDYNRDFSFKFNLYSFVDRGNLAVLKLQIKFVF